MNYEQRAPYGMYKSATTNIAGPTQTHGPGPHLMGAETLIGNNVFNATGEDLGEI